MPRYIFYLEEQIVIRGDLAMVLSKASVRRANEAPPEDFSPDARRFPIEAEDDAAAFARLPSIASAQHIAHKRRVGV